jgi:hypothetical protein
MIILDNLGSSLVYLAIIALIFLFYLLLTLLCFIFPFSGLIKLKEWLHKKIFWNSIIAFLINQFQPLFMLSIVNFYDMREFTTVDKFCESFAISMATVTVSLMVLGTIILKMKNANLIRVKDYE